MPITIGAHKAAVEGEQSTRVVDYFLLIEGAKQGKFKGETRDKKHAGELDIISWEYEVLSPRDLATGQASGIFTIAQLDTA